MIKHILAFVAAAQPLRDWRRCATGAAARLAPLRDWRRCATTFISIAFLTMALMFVPAQAQVTCNFGSHSSPPSPAVDRDACPPLAFNKVSDGYYRVMISVAGMVFDHTREYSLQLSSNAFGQYQVSNKILGIYHSKRTGTTPPLYSGDVMRMTTELLGAGVYDIRIVRDYEDFTIQLDLTDGNSAKYNTSSRGFHDTI